jgi:hypothetical protein
MSGDNLKCKETVLKCLSNVESQPIFPRIQAMYLFTKLPIFVEFKLKG